MEENQIMQFKNGQRTGGDMSLKTYKWPTGIRKA